MPPDYLHHHPDFADLLCIVGQEQSIDPALVEKDYWVMHCLYGLQKMGLTFELKGGTSLSKGFGIINRFSEDMDLRIDPPADRRSRLVAIRTNQPIVKAERNSMTGWRRSSPLTVSRQFHVMRSLTMKNTVVVESA